MAIANSRMAPALFALGALAPSTTVSTAARAQEPAVDPAAVQTLKKMADYLGGLQQFSVERKS
jgi:hypothetical protein